MHLTSPRVYIVNEWVFSALIALIRMNRVSFSAMNKWIFFSNFLKLVKTECSVIIVWKVGLFMSSEYYPFPSVDGNLYWSFHACIRVGSIFESLSFFQQKLGVDEIYFLYSSVYLLWLDFMSDWRVSFVFCIALFYQYGLIWNLLCRLNLSCEYTRAKLI